MSSAPFPLLRNLDIIPVRALFLGERLDTRALEASQRLAGAPLTIAAGERGCAVLFRYGAAVLFGLEPMEEVSFLGHLRPLVAGAFDAPESEEVNIELGRGYFDGIEEGRVVFGEISVERLQLLADALAKSVVLAHYEKTVSGVFDRIEPLAVRLQQGGKTGPGSRELLAYIGGTLLIQHRTVGRIETVEKPEILWEHPELERLHHRFTDEYELRERQLALDTKVSLIGHTASTLLELLQNRRSLRVEWYITILIVVEILLTLYQLFFRGTH